MIQSVERAMHLLNAVASAGDWVGVRELARVTDLKVPTAQQLLKTLQACGYLEFDETTRRYRIGLAALLLGDGVDTLRHMAEFVQPYVARMFAELKETAAVLAMEQGKVIVVDWKQSNHALSVAQPQRRVIEHSHCMASGKVLLAYQDEEFQRQYAQSEPLAELGPNTPATVEELLEEFRKIRAAGLAESIDARSSGVAAFSAPVFGASGKIAMALACSAPMTRMNDAQAAKAKEMLLTISHEMTNGLCAG